MVNDKALLLILFSSHFALGQTLYPLIENGIKFCYFCTNDSVVDKVWRFEDEIYTKLKSNNFEYELFRLSDSTFHLRKYKNENLIKKGNILLRKENLVFVDTIVCFDCHPINLWEEVIRINYIVNPIQIDEWVINEDNNTVTSGNFDNKGNKIKIWKYKTMDTTVYLNHDTNESYFYKPNATIVKSNLNWIFNKFYTSFAIKETTTIQELFKDLEKRLFIKMSLTPTQNIGNLSMEFKQNGEVEIQLLRNSNIFFSKKTNWRLTENGQLELIDGYEQSVEFTIWTLGKKQFTFCHISGM